MKKQLTVFALMLAMLMAATFSMAAESSHGKTAGAAGTQQAEAVHKSAADGDEEHSVDKDTDTSAAARKKFLQDTLELRASIVKKNMELEILRLEDPEDDKAVKKIRKALIDLNAELRKKALDDDMELHGMDIGMHMKGYSGTGEHGRGNGGRHGDNEAGHDGKHDGGKMGKKSKMMKDNKDDEDGDKKKCK